MRIGALLTVRENELTGWGCTGWVLTRADLPCRDERTVALPRRDMTIGPEFAEPRLMTVLSGVGATGVVRVRPCLLPARERTSPPGVREETYAGLRCAGLLVTIRVAGEICVTGLTGSSLVRACLRSSRLRTSIPRLEDP